MPETTQRGYLLLGDISGYTSFVAGTELEHAQEILSELLELIVKKFQSLLTISKLEGDAVFAYVSEAKLPEGELLLELVESTYVAFRDRREAAHRRTTCTCAACRAIPTLDLKFFAHYGDYFVQDIAGTKELVGSAVNLIHRLLKNHVTEATGWRAYALFTETVLAHLKVPSTEDWHPQPEAYEHLGAVQTLSFNLQPRYEELVAAPHLRLDPDTAHIAYRWQIDAPPPTVWAWLNEPQLRLKWEGGLETVPIYRPGGRNGPGARNHCLHGKNVQFIETVLDWRPFEYFTVEKDARNGAVFVVTYVLEPTTNGNTCLVQLGALRMPMPGFLLKPMCQLLARLIRVKETYSNLPLVIAAEAHLSTANGN